MNRTIKKIIRQSDDIGQVALSLTTLMDRLWLLAKSCCGPFWTILRFVLLLGLLGKLGWVAALVCLLQFGNGDMGVNLRGFYGGMTHHFLDQPDVAAMLQQLGRKRMPEEVATSLLTDVSLFDQGMNLGTEPVGGHPLPGRHHEQRQLIDGGTERGPGLDQPFLDPPQSP